MTPSSCDQVADRLALLPGEALDPAEARRVESHLAQCASCRARVESVFLQDRALAELAAESIAADVAARISRQLQAVVRPRRRPQWAVWSAVAAAAVLLLAVSMLWWNSDQPADRVVAHIDDLEGRVVLVTPAGPTPIEAEQPVSSGSVLRTIGDESHASVVFADGTRLEVGADTTVTIHDGLKSDAARGKRVVVTEGFLTADVAKQPPGEPMHLSTPQAELVVLGTRFSVSGGSDVTYVGTDEGAVQVTRKADGASIELAAGFETTVSDHTRPLAAQSLSSTLAVPRQSFDGYWTAAVSPDGATLATTRYLGGDVELWNLADGSRRTRFAAHRRRVLCTAFSPDGAILATGSNDSTVKLWSLASGELHATIEVGRPWIADLAFGPDGQSLAVLGSEEGAEERMITVWDIATRQTRFAPLDSSVQRWAFSPDGSLLATYSRETKRITLWDLAAGRARATFSTPVGNNVFSLAFSPDGMRLAVDGSSGVVVLLDVASGEIARQFERRGGRIFGMAFSHDGRQLATGHQDGTVRLWDMAASTQQIASNIRPSTHVGVLEFIPDNRTLVAREIRLAAGGQHRDGAVLLWDVPPTALP